VKPAPVMFVRVVWLALPLALVPALEGALADRSSPVAVLVSMAGWLGWTAGIVAVLAPRTLGLTYLRVAAPAALVLAIWAALGDVSIAVAIAAVLLSAVAVVIVLSPAVTDAFVNGSAYGPERRFALRTPTAIVVGPALLVWVLIVVGVATGPLLLATEQWVAGGIALAIGWPVAAVAARSLHQLARRWLVFVPAGLVLHDPTAVASQLIPRGAVATIAPALAGSDAHDLTGGAAGLALEVRLVDPIVFEPARGRRNPPDPVETDRFLVSPSRPGAVMKEARARRFTVA
jgi:hypothetical protein